MIAKSAVVCCLAGLALAQAGCEQQGVRAYEGIASLDRALSVADLVIVGYVVDTEDLDHFPEGDVWANVLGTTGQDCVVKVRVTMNAEKVVKGPVDLHNPVTFFYFGPCFHGDPAVLLGRSLPPILNKGRRLEVFLNARNGDYWLIAHQRVPPGTESEKQASPAKTP
jgi:hypothetical protein